MDNTVTIQTPNVLYRTIRTLGIVTYLLTMAFGLSTAQILTAVLVPFSQKLLIRINSWIAGCIWRIMQRVVERVNDMDITFSGEELPRKENAIVISNHVSMIDFYLINAVAIRKGMINHCSYFAKDSLKYIPFWGWGMWFCGMLLIKRNWLKDRKSIEAVFRRLRTYRPPVWVISFLEGTRMTPKKLRESQAFLQSRNMPPLHNLLAPRTKGFCETVRQLRDAHVKHVYDFTIAYHHAERGFGVAPSLLRLHSHSLRGEYRFHVHTRRFAIEDLPQEDAELSAWVHKLYREKDKLLEDLKTNWTKNLQPRRIPLE